MDGARFDSLTRRLAAPQSRRQVVRALGGALAGLVAASNDAYTYWSGAPAAVPWSSR